MTADESLVLQSVLRAFRPRSETEAADVAAATKVAAGGDPWSRHTPLHFTGSAVIVHPATERVLLRWHDRQQAWLQVGGHADPGEVDPFDVAVREAVEETGLPDLAAWPDPAPTIVHLAIVAVPAKGHEPAHHHIDLRYLLATDRPEEMTAESPDAPLRWLSLSEAEELTGEDNLRVTLARTRELLASAG